MTRTYSNSPSAQQANTLVEALQARFVDKLSAVASTHGEDNIFSPVSWLREDGQYGGGERYVASESSALFNRASVNVSQVHYQNNPEKSLDSATAISTIIHPQSPLAPSVHIHISWTEMKDGHGYWRVMADLNPAIPEDTDRDEFAAALKAAAGEYYSEGAAQGDRYFYIPALERHRGVTHFYLEAFNSGDAAADYALAKRVGEAAIDTYVDILSRALARASDVSESDRELQRDYHTLYFLQVLTLDRGTTSGLMVHNENDVGILGSLPSHVKRSLLESWVERMPPPQNALLNALIDALPDESLCLVDEAVKQKLAQGVRHHYQQYPEALDMQASGSVVPPTVANHK